jgi:predicted kinase
VTQVTFLVGLPASGKTTWRDQCRTDQFVASSDDFIEAMAKDQGKTYNDVFLDAIEPATKHFNHMISHAVSQNANLIIDRTNTNVDGRRKILARIPFDWKKVAIVFKCLDFEVWKKRLMNRPGKLIPASAITDMMMKFETPTIAEEFDEIIKYYT